ncbi:MAG: amidase family protein, partial [Thermomicrobiales bacterium]
MTSLSAAEARVLLDNRHVSAVELTDAYLDRIRNVEDDVRAFIEVTPEVARGQAAVADSRIARGDAAPLTGIPVALKDVLCTVDAPTTAGSRLLKGYRSPYDA